MSFRELRDFTEIMKALGYTHLISVENFRSPNFELVAEILFWLVHRYDPTAELIDKISGDHGVKFLKSAAQIIYNKAHIKLNIKQLYKGDGFAVKELLKVSRLLYDALQADDIYYTGSISSSSSNNSNNVINHNNPKDINKKINQIVSKENLANKIVDVGAEIYNLLANQEELKYNRQLTLKFIDSLNINLESNDAHDLISRKIRQQINLVDDNIKELKQLIFDLKKDEVELHNKIDKKERINKKRKNV